MNVYKENHNTVFLWNVAYANITIHSNNDFFLTPSVYLNNNRLVRLGLDLYLM